jgi:hypothetical protein
MAVYQDRRGETGALQRVTPVRDTEQHMPGVKDDDDPVCQQGAAGDGRTALMTCIVTGFACQQ